MFHFLLFGPGRGPRPNSKKKHAPAPSERAFFLLFKQVGVFIVLLFGRGACCFFCCLGGNRVLLLLFGRVRVFFAVSAGGVGGGGAWFFLVLFGRVGVFFVFFVFAVWAGVGSSLTYRSAWLVFKRPSNKKDQTAKKKKTVVPPLI